MFWPLWLWLLSLFTDVPRAKYWNNETYRDSVAKFCIARAQSRFCCLVKNLYKWFIGHLKQSQYEAVHTKKIRPINNHWSLCWRENSMPKSRQLWQFWWLWGRQILWSALEDGLSLRMVSKCEQISAYIWTDTDRAPLSTDIWFSHEPITICRAEHLTRWQGWLRRCVKLRDYQTCALAKLQYRFLKDSFITLIWRSDMKRSYMLW